MTDLVARVSRSSISVFSFTIYFSVYILLGQRTFRKRERYGLAGMKRLSVNLYFCIHDNKIYKNKTRHVLKYMWGVRRWSVEVFGRDSVCFSISAYIILHDWKRPRHEWCSAAAGTSEGYQRAGFLCFLFSLFYLWCFLIFFTYCYSLSTCF